MSEHLVLNKTDDLNETLNTDKLKDSVYYNRIPTKLKKTFYFVMILLIIGLTLFSIGIYFSIIDDEVQDGISYMIIGLICIIPGLYYTVQFIRAKREKDEEYRREILNDIPPM